MITDNGLVIGLLVIGIIVIANGLMFLAVRSAVRGGKNRPDYLKNTQDLLNQSLQQDSKELGELRKRVEELENKNK